jgi:hypothetical protein
MMGNCRWLANDAVVQLGGVVPGRCCGTFAVLAPEADGASTVMSTFAGPASEPSERLLSRPTAPIAARVPVTARQVT